MKKLKKTIWIMRRMFYLFRLRRRLKVTDFSIISNNCVGGVMLHDLNQRFLTPTVNLYILPEDFYRYVSHLADFQNAELTEVKNSGKSFPVGSLHHPEHGSVTIYFMHYSSFDEAKDKWVKRSRRIKYDKLCIVIYNISSNIELLKKINSLPYIIFNISTSKHDGVENENLIDLGNNAPDSIFNFKKGSTARFLDDVDYVSFLNNAFSSEQRGLKHCS